MALFAGHERASGTHGVPTRKPDSLKWEIKSTALTVHEPATEEKWKSHIEGRRPLGVIPITQDGTCKWGSVDYDVYDADILAVIGRAEKAKLPLVPCRSKSGGLHLFLFLSEPCAAAQVQEALREASAAIGIGGSEIFPKQISLSERSFGNWIIMPYFGGTYDGKLKDQVGIKKTGAEMTIGEFVTTAEKSRVSAADLAKTCAGRRATSLKLTGGDFSDGPPCLQHLARDGFLEDGRKRAIFMIGIYLQKAHPDDWKERLDEHNRRMMRPPLASEEVVGVARSLEKRDYEYTCKAEPMRSHCDSQLCRTRPHGVGSPGDFPVIDQLEVVNTNPAIWVVHIEGHAIEVNTATLLEYRAFHRACAEPPLMRVYRSMKPDAWFGVVQAAMETKGIIDENPDVGLVDQFREVLGEFLTNRRRGDTVEDVQRGVPWLNEEDQRWEFRLRDLCAFLKREGDRDTTRIQAARMIEKMGGGKHFRHIRGQGVNLRFVPLGAVERAQELAPPKPKPPPM